MPPPPDRIHRRRERGADPIMPVLEVRPSEPDVRICQRNVLIDQAHGRGAAKMGARRPRPTAMTSRRDVDAVSRTGNASSRFSEDLRRVLETELLKGPCTSIEIARQFSMHHRTLSRHLAREGITFQQIADEVRFAIARDLLANTDIALDQISVMLRYSEPSAFTRAFRRWSGQPPSAWRASHARSRKLPRKRTVPRSR